MSEQAIRAHIRGTCDPTFCQLCAIRREGQERRAAAARREESRR